jgi:hypothetical protein
VIFLTGDASNRSIPDFPVGWSDSGTVPWTTTTGNSGSAPNHAFISDLPFTSDSSLTSPVISVTQQKLQLSFQNKYQTESGHDFGVLEVSVNGGAFVDIESTTADVLTGGYNSVSTTGRRGWSGDSGGYLNTSIDLPSYELGSTLQFRWRFITDSSTAQVGWNIDTVLISGEQPGWQTTLPTASAPVPGRYSLHVDPGVSFAARNFGNSARPGEIHGQLFLDANRNGKRDPATELALPGWTVYLDQNHNQVLDPGEVSTVTAADGTYSFTNLAALTLQNVTVILPPGWEPTTFPADVSAQSLSSQNGFVFDDPLVDHRLGTSVSAAGDVNGDGFDDFLIGRPSVGLSTPASSQGFTYVVFGGPGGLPSNFSLDNLDGNNGFTITSRDSASNSNGLGSSVSTPGDINDDGYSDILIGAPLADTNGTQSGEAFVLFGKASGFPATIDLTNPATFSLDGTNGFVIRGLGDFDSLGSAVNGVGDVNGDGIDDFVIAAPGVNADRGAGAAYLIFGRNTRINPFTATFDLTALNGSNGTRLDGADSDHLGNEVTATGPTAGGQSISRAGDVNGDGIGDLIIGAKTGLVPTTGGTSERRGKAYVVFGKPAGWGAALRLDSLNGTTGFVIRGAAKDDEFGISVAGAGDINGDHYDDIVIGGDHADPHGANSGAGYVIFGKDTRQAAFPAAMDVSALNGTNGFRISGVSSGDGAGISVSGAGDINGDGLADLVIGADHVDRVDAAPAIEAGAAYFVFGSRTSFPTNLDLSTLNGRNGFRLIGGVANGDLGFSVSQVGDISGDGLSDVLIGGNTQSTDASGTFVDITRNVAIVYGRADSRRPVTLDAGEPLSNLDFPVRPISGEIHGLVFDDQNRNGVRDPGEPGVPGVTLLLDLNSNSAKDNGEPTAVTDASGKYVFANLPVFLDLANPTQHYRVLELVSVDRLDLTQSFPQKLLGSVAVTPFVSSSQLKTGYAISGDGQGGLLLTGTDGTGTGFNQQNVLRVSGDGQAVGVLSAADHPQSITSDGTFAYWIDLDADGTHTRVYRQPLSGGPRELVYSAVTPTDSNGKIVSGTGLDFVPGNTSATPESLVALDALQGAITRLPAQPDVTDGDLTSIGAARSAGLISQSHAQFLDVENGVIYIVDPGFVATGSDRSQDVAAQILSIPVSGGAYTTLYTGNLPGFDLYGTAIPASRPKGIAVHDGILYVSGEHAIYSLSAGGGVPVVFAADERFRSLSGMTYVNGSLYVIDNGTTRTATVWRVELHPLLQQSVNIDVFSNERSWDVTLGPGETAPNLDFARFDPTAAIGAGGAQSIRGVVFVDQNNNGVQDGSEPGQPGVTVFLDLNRNGVLDAGDVSTVTLSGDVAGTPIVERVGEYVFSNLVPGLYDVLLADTNLAAALSTSHQVALSPTDLISGSGTSTGTPRAATIGDWNHDGLNDLVVADSETGKVGIFQNTGDQHFIKVNELDVGGIPNSVTLINLNGDALPDLAIGQAQFGSVSLWKNLGNGQFQQLKTAQGLPQSLVLSSPGGSDFGIPSIVVSADFNNDGRTDLAIVDSQANHPRVFVFLRNAGDFSFAAPQILVTPGTVKGLITADLNGDSAPDLAGTVADTDQLLVWTNLNNGTVRFPNTPQSVTVGDGPTALAALQVNGAGGLDLAVANTAAGTISILANNGAAGWSLLSTLALTVPPTGLQAADIDGQHGPDLVVAMGDGEDSSQPLVVFYHSGDNSQPYTQSVAYGASIFDFNGVKTATGLSLSVGNLDLGGAPDLVVVNSAAKTVSVLRNGPDRSGQTVRLTASGTSSSATDINFGVGGSPQVSFDTATGKLTITLPVPTDLEVGTRGTQVELRFGGVVDNGVNVAAGDIASVEIQGSEGNDRIDLSAVNIATGFTHTGGVNIMLNGNGGADTITGSSFADQINGGDGQDILNGLAGNDTVTGGQGDDYLYGGDGNDTLDGQAGNNRLDGGAGINILLGGSGNASPVLTSPDTASVPENSTAVLHITATDADVPAQPLTFSITGGPDQARFTLTPNGNLSFVTAPNFEAPVDSNADNIYLVQVTVSDGQGGSAVQNLTITVTDVVENAAPTVQLNGPAATWVKKQPPVSILPQITVTSASSLGGGVLSFDTTAVGNKKKMIDIIGKVAAADIAPLGTSTGLKFASGHATLQVQLKADVTVAAIQSFLRGIKFSTKGAGLKTLTRTFHVTLANSTGQSSSISQTINVRTKP